MGNFIEAVTEYLKVGKREPDIIVVFNILKPDIGILQLIKIGFFISCGVSIFLGLSLLASRLI